MALVILIALINTKEGPCHGSAGWSSVSDRGDQCSFPGKFLVDKVALGQDMYVKIITF